MCRRSIQIKLTTSDSLTTLTTFNDANNTAFACSDLIQANHFKEHGLELRDSLPAARMGGGPGAGTASGYIRGALGFWPERRSNRLTALDIQFIQALSPVSYSARAPLGSCLTSHQPSILMRSGPLPKAAGSLQMPKSPISIVPFSNSR